MSHNCLFHQVWRVSYLRSRLFLWLLILIGFQIPHAYSPEGFKLHQTSIDGSVCIDKQGNNLINSEILFIYNEKSTFFFSKLSLVIRAESKVMGSKEILTEDAKRCRLQLAKLAMQITNVKIGCWLCKTVALWQRLLGLFQIAYICTKSFECRSVQCTICAPKTVQRLSVELWTHPTCSKPHVGDVVEVAQWR